MIELIGNRDVIPCVEVSAEDRVLAAHLIVNAAHHLSVIPTIDVAVGRIATRINRRGKLARDVQRSFTEECRIDLVVVEWGSQVDLSGRIAGGGSKVGEVAGQHFFRGNEGSYVRGIRPCCCSLIACEEEELILHDRPTDRSTELVALQSTAGGCEVLSSVEQIVAEKFKQVAMEGVRARFGYRIDISTGLPAVLSRHAAGFHFELLQRVRKRKRLTEATILVRVGSTV